MNFMNKNKIRQRMQGDGKGIILDKVGYGSF